MLSQNSSFCDSEAGKTTRLGIRQAGPNRPIRLGTDRKVGFDGDFRHLKLPYLHPDLGGLDRFAIFGCATKKTLPWQSSEHKLALHCHAI